MPVTLPIDQLSDRWALPRGARVGAVLHPASVGADLTPTLEILKRHSGDLFHLKALFGPQHGFSGSTQDNMIEWEGFQHPDLGIPVFSLYGDHREPTPEMLDGLDVLLVDLQDVGSRYYTFIWTLFLCMRACGQAGVKVIVADRPNPINGETVEGPMPDPRFGSFVGLHPLPPRHGRTIGELAIWFRDEALPECDLTVLPMSGWNRGMWFDETGLPWVMPSPNMPTLDTATAYAGMCLLEGTNLSEGRGTTRPFEIMGAPWIDSREFCHELRRLDLPGAHFREIHFEPTFQKHAGKVCGGTQVHVLDRSAFLPFQTGLEIIRLARTIYPSQFGWKAPPYEYETERLPIEILLGGPVSQFFAP